MKSFVVALLFAAVAAEDGYTCVDTDPSSWTSTDLTDAAVTTSTECKTVCDAAITAGETEANDWCCSSVADSGDSSLACTLYNLATAEGDIRADAGDAGTVTSSAWAWVAGVAADSMADIAAAAEEEAATEEDDEETEEDEDMSVRMTASAVAAASIAMLAM